MSKRGSAPEELLRFLDVFEKSGFSFGEVSARPGEIAHASLAQEVLAFTEKLYETGFLIQFDWPEWQDVAETYVNDLSKLKTADVETLRKLLTLHVRKDRFCDGHLLDMFESGHIAAILRRLRELHQLTTKPRR